MAYDYATSGKGKTAAPHPFNPDMVITRDHGTLSRFNAGARGYTLPPKVDSSAGIQASLDARIEQFVSLPEAAGKVRSASRLAKDNPTMGVDAARSFLRGAPTDAAITAQRHAPQPTATAPRAARLEQIKRLGKRR